MRTEGRTRDRSSNYVFNSYTLTKKLKITEETNKETQRTGGKGFMSLA